jgi:four helix bundle protein
METSNDDQKKFDLEERTARFGESVIRFARTLRSDMVSRPLVSQLVRAATSVGANYLEADDSGTRREFHYRISLCRREARETKHWLRMLVAAVPECRPAALPLWQEARELHLIFAAINRHKTQE